MAGLLGFLAAGAAKGAGDGIVAEARAKRQAAIDELENSRLVSRERESRAFQAEQGSIERSARSSEAATEREFRSKEAATARSAAAEESRLDREGVLKAATAKADGSPPEVKEFFDESGQPYKAQWNTETRSWDKIGGSKASSNSGGVTISPDGTVQVGGAGMKLTEGQSKDLNYLKRGTAALSTIEQNEGALASAGQNVANAVPGVGNYLTSKEFQKANQAGKEFLAAVLRKDTGAAITKQEFDIYGPMFLPQPGDGAEVLDQKRAARQRAMEAIKLGLGTATPLADEPVLQNPDSGEKTGRKASPGATSTGVKWSVE